MRTIGTFAMIAALSVMGSQLASSPWAAAEEGQAVRSAEVVAGTVTDIDSDRGRVTVRAADGKTYEFQASQETLRNLKEGDRIEAKKREDGQ